VSEISEVEQTMEEHLSDRIRERAYQIWVASGSPHGEADQHWLTAEREILATLIPAVPNGRAKRRTARAVSKQVNARNV
jgi:Protein of unknown function (DUF2934)